MSDAQKQRVWELIEQPLKERGFDIADMALSKYKHNITLRVFVYGQNGVSLDACAELSGLIGDVLESTDLFERGYMLEVSSPGLDRPLKTATDFKHRIGETVSVQFADKDKKKTKGEISAAREDAFELTNDDGSVWIDLSDIVQAKIVF